MFAIIVITLGVLFDLIEFVVHCILFLKRKRVPSPTPLLGLVLVITGLMNVFDYEFSLLFFGLLMAAILFHVARLTVFPSLFYAIVNAHYGRDRRDYSPLPPKE